MKKIHFLSEPPAIPLLEDCPDFFLLFFDAGSPVPSTLFLRPSNEAILPYTFVLLGRTELDPPDEEHGGAETDEAAGLSDCEEHPPSPPLSTL